MSTTSSPGTHPAAVAPPTRQRISAWPTTPTRSPTSSARSGSDPSTLRGTRSAQGWAIDVYGRHRRLVCSLVLSGASAGWRGSLPPAEVEARLNRALAELDRPPAEWADSYLAGLFGRSVPPETAEAARTMMLDVRPAGARPMLTAFASADLRAVLPAIAAPTLLIYGAEDVRAPRGVAEALHTAIPGSRLILVPAAGHDVNLEAPDEYDAAVRAFPRTVGEPAAGPSLSKAGPSFSKLTASQVKARSSSRRERMVVVFDNQLTNLPANRAHRHAREATAASMQARS
jgi:dienelactone hydrolase